MSHHPPDSRGASPEGGPAVSVCDQAAHTATQVFHRHRELLFSIVYNTLGNVTDTEDVLQETWLAWTARHRGDAEPVANPRAYLVRIAVNRTLAQQTTLSRRKEAYVGPWLPEPLVRPLGDPPVPDVTLWGDGGGLVRTAGLRPVHGRERVARLLSSVAPGKGLDVAYRSVNGDPSALLLTGDAPFAVLVLDLTPGGDQVCGIYTVTNPDKLARVK